jgi:hypothetical protein
MAADVVLFMCPGLSLEAGQIDRGTGRAGYFQFQIYFLDTI